MVRSSGLAAVSNNLLTPDHLTDSEETEAFHGHDGPRDDLRRGYPSPGLLHYLLRHLGELGGIPDLGDGALPVRLEGRDRSVQAVSTFAGGDSSGWESENGRPGSINLRWCHFLSLEDDLGHLHAYAAVVDEGGKSLLQSRNRSAITVRYPQQPVPHRSDPLLLSLPSTQVH